MCQLLYQTTEVRLIKRLATMDSVTLVRVYCVHCVPHVKKRLKLPGAKFAVVDLLCPGPFRAKLLT